MMEDYKECKQALKEVGVILDNTSLEDVNKIPNQFLDFIEKNQDNSYNPQIDIKKPLNQQNLQPQTIDILSLIYLKYWCENEEKRESYKKLLNENGKKEQEKAINQNNQNSQNGQNNQSQNNQNNQNNQMKNENKSNQGLNNNQYAQNRNVSIVVVKKPNLFQKMINWITGRK